MKGALLLDVVIRKGATILELFAREDQTLLVRRNSTKDIYMRSHLKPGEISHIPFLVLDLRLDVIDGIGRLDLEGASKGLYEDLHVAVI